MRAVNLLPRDDARTSRGLPSPWVLLAATVPVLAGGLVYLGYSHEHATVAEKKAELAIVQAHLDHMTSLQAGVAAQSSLYSLRGQRSAALQDALSKQMPWDVTLEDLARVMPKGVFLTGVSATSPTPSATAPAPITGTTTPTPTTPAVVAQTFTLNGTAANHDQIAQLLERLSLLPMITNVTLSSTQTTTTSAPPPTESGTAPAKKAPAPKPTLQFSLTAGVQQPPEAADQ
jgi:Tfp pilus assembly protein PilN